MKTLLSLAAGAAVLCATPVGIPGQSQLLDSLIVANALPVRLEAGRLVGPGAEFILREAAAAQFVALGEEHNTSEIPEITTALFAHLGRSSGFEYLALEQDPVAVSLAVQRERRSVRDSVVAIAQRYPYAFTFVSDQELFMIADVAGFSRAAGHPVWGCDQAFGATHVLDRILALTRRSPARAMAARLRDAAAAQEAKRDLDKSHYMGTVSKASDFAALRALVGPTAGSELDFLTDALVASERIYGHFREQRGYDNAAEREEYMKTCFIQEYERAMAIDRGRPKVVLKFGHWHLYRGFSPNNVQTLGNFVSEFARANRAGSFHLAIFPHGDPGEYGDLRRWSDPIPKMLATSVSTAGWTAVDFRPLRRQFGRIARELSADQREQLRRWIFGYDAALFVGRMRRGTYLLNPGVAY